MKIKLKPIPLPTNHSMCYLRFFVILFVTVGTIPLVSDMITHVLYVLISNDSISKEIFHEEVGSFIEIITITWLSLWSIKKSVEMFNDITSCVRKIKFRKATSLYNPSNKSPIHLKKPHKKT